MVSKILPAAYPGGILPQRCFDFVAEPDLAGTFAGGCLHQKPVHFHREILHFFTDISGAAWFISHALGMAIQLRSKEEKSRIFISLKRFVLNRIVVWVISYTVLHLVALPWATSDKISKA
jgi:hypothetical protein